MVVLAAVVFVPLLDLLMAVVRRTRKGLSPFTPDKMHLHHRLLEIGHSHRRAVLLIYLWAGVLAFGAVALALIDDPFVVLWSVGIGLVVAVLASAVPRAPAEPLIRRAVVVKSRSRVTGHGARVNAEDTTPSQVRTDKAALARCGSVAAPAGDGSRAPTVGLAEEIVPMSATRGEELPLNAHIRSSADPPGRAESPGEPRRAGAG